MVCDGEAEECDSEGTAEQMPGKDGAAASVGNALWNPSNDVFRGTEHNSSTDQDARVELGKVNVSLVNICIL